MDRDAELAAFKRLNLSLIASAFGYEIDKKKSTTHSVLMRSGGDKIVISKNGGDYVYFSVHDPTSAGTVIDLVQRTIEPGCSLGRVRQIVRPFLGGSYRARVAETHQHQAVIEPNRADVPGVAARYARFNAITQPHPYLCGERGVPFELLQTERLRGRVRHCPRLGSIVFPHSSADDFATNADAEVCGYEIKGRGVTMFSKGGVKALWQSAGCNIDSKLVVAESGLDAISYLAVHGEEGTRVVSLSGQMNSAQPGLLLVAIGRMPSGSRLVAAFDNDPAGDKLTASLADLLARAARPDLGLIDDRPKQRGHDWNQVLCAKSSSSLTRSFKPTGLGR